MQTIPMFLKAYDQDDSYFLSIDSILHTMPSDSLLIDPEYCTHSSIVASGLAEVVFDNCNTDPNAPGFTIESSVNGVVWRINYPVEQGSTTPPIYLITESYALG